MHRHGYKGRKFGRERDQRRALLKGLATSLIERGAIKTTMAKAKELVPYAEVLITKAKVGGLHNRRQVIAALNSIEQAHRLVDEIAPQLQGRTSGHLRVTSVGERVGDNASMAEVSFVDALTPGAAVDRPAETPAAPAEPATAAKTHSTPAAKTPSDEASGDSAKKEAKT